MTTKVKSKILYIQSDASSDDNQNKDSQLDKTLKNPPERNHLQTLGGSHRLQYNKISKGLFVSEKQQDYNLQPLKQYAQVVQQTAKSPVAAPKVKRMKTQISYPSNQIIFSQPVQPEVSESNEQARKDLTELKRAKILQRSKKLMFQLNQQSEDDEKTSENKQNEEIKADKANKIKFDTDKAEQKPKTVETAERKQVHKEAEIILLTPAYMQQKIDKKQFLIGRLPKNSRLQCKILKKNEIQNLMLPQYDMYFRNYLFHISSCKKFIGSIGANYRMSTSLEDFSYVNHEVIGKVRSVDSDNLYNVYDDGVNFQKIENKNSGSQGSVRMMLATVRIRSGKGPRIVEAYVLKSTDVYQNLIGFSLKKQMNLQNLYNIQQNRKNIHYFRSRPPEWIKHRQQYYLNFSGRINEASIRNFILEDPETKQQVLMFGKNANNIYSLDISYPLTAQIGFGIAIPQLDKSD